MANDPRGLPGFEIEEDYATGEIRVRRKGLFGDYTTRQQVREKLWPDTDIQALKDRVQELEGEVEMLRDEKAWLQDEVDYLEHALARDTKDDIPF